MKNSSKAILFSPCFLCVDNQHKHRSVKYKERRFYIILILNVYFRLIIFNYNNQHSNQDNALGLCTFVCSWWYTWRSVGSNRCKWGALGGGREGNSYKLLPFAGCRSGNCADIIIMACHAWIRIFIARPFSFCWILAVINGVRWTLFVDMRWAHRKTIIQYVYPVERTTGNPSIGQLASP